MANDNEYPEYGLKISNDASDQRTRLAVEFHPVVIEILRKLAINPLQEPDRLVPASRDGKNFVYMNPNPPIQITFEVAANEKNIYVISIAAPEFKPRKKIFLSYSHEDEAWLDKVKKFLTVLEQQGVIDFWDDAKIQPGTEWKAEIQKALDSAEAAILLVSQDFLNSDFITKFELPKLLDNAENQGKRIFWIPLSESTVFQSHKEITKYQSLVKDPHTPLEALADSECKKALVQVSKELGELNRKIA